MTKVVALTAFVLLPGLAGCGAAKTPGSKNDTAAVPATGGADKPQPDAAEYTIKYRDALKDGAVGDAVHFTVTTASETNSKTISPAGKVLQEKGNTTGETLVYTQTILEKPDPGKPPTRVRRRYERAEKRAGDKTTPYGFQGKTVLIERKDGKWQFHYEGGPELALEDALVVYRDFPEEGSGEDRLKAILPGKPVKVGEPWALDAATLAKGQEKALLLFSVGGAKASGRGVLRRAYKQGGRQFGVLELTIEVPLTALGQVKLDEGSRVSNKVTVDGCIDATSVDLTITSENTGGYSAALTEAGDKGDKMTVKAVGKSTTTRKDIGKK